MQRPEFDWNRDGGLSRDFEGEEGQAERIAAAALASSHSERSRPWRIALLTAALVTLLVGVGDRFSRSVEGEAAKASGSAYRIEGRAGIVTLEDSSGQIIWILAEGDMG